MVGIGRRQFISALGGAAPVAALLRTSTTLAQQSVPVIGFLGLTSPQEFAVLMAAFQRGLNETGVVEGQNVAVEYRWAYGQFGQLPSLASDLVQRQVSVLVAAGTPASALAAKTATTTIPIVFITGSDPIGMGLVQSLNRPAGNATGIYMLTSSLEPKRLELMHELVPNAEVAGVIVDPNSPETARQVKDLSAAAGELNQRISILNAGSEVELESVFAVMAEQHVKAAVLTSSPLYLPQRQKIIALAARYAIPIAYFLRDFAVDGGLLSYGTSLTDAYRQVGLYTGAILKGDKPSDLPVQQSVKVELVINLRTAKTLGLTFPLPLLGRADEVIE
jgi:putative tryptophan/tyrosine transport system substrate-binding protein